MSEKITLEQLTTAAQSVAEEKGLIGLTQRALCEKLNIPRGSFTHATGTTFEDLIQSLDLVRLVTSDSFCARTRPEMRRVHLVQCGVEVALNKGYRAVTRADIAEIAHVSPGLVSHYLGGTQDIRVAILQHAIDNDFAPIISQAVLLNDVYLYINGNADELLDRARAFMRSL